MVLVVRQDLKMGAGKVASQCAHAATGMYAELLQSNRSLLRQWEQCGQPKIVVTCKNLQEMNKLKDTADLYGLPTLIIADAGRTQVQEGSKTVLAIGPGMIKSGRKLWWILLRANNVFCSKDFSRNVLAAIPTAASQRGIVGTADDAAGRRLGGGFEISVPGYALQIDPRDKVICDGIISVQNLISLEGFVVEVGCANFDFLIFDEELHE
ncbi:hypothetical protein HPP92_006045 [Vanilla planifolia]|nr:hypothetical protein HPP92_006045 [Vanilla planifolia]